MAKKRSSVGVALATGVGLGYSPVASGTVGSLPGILLVLALHPLLQWPGGIWLQVLAAIALAALAIPICEIGERHYGTKDDGRIVADEYLTFPLCMLGLPWAEHLWIFPMAFVVARIMDILKPPPAHQLQSIHGGFGIVIDDVAASLYALAANHLLVWLVLRG